MHVEFPLEYIIATFRIFLRVLDDELNWLTRIVHNRSTNVCDVLIDILRDVSFINEGQIDPLLEVEQIIVLGHEN